MDHADRCWSLAMDMFAGDENDFSANCRKKFEEKIDDYGMDHAELIMKEKYRANGILCSDDPDEERILEYLSAGRLLLSLSPICSLTCRSTTKDEFTRTGRIALIQGPRRHLVIFTDQETIAKKFGQEAWIYQLNTKVALTTEFFGTKRKKQEVYLVQFSTTEEATLFKDCFVKLNYGGCIITELFGPTPLDQMYSRGFPKERNEWNSLQTSAILELKNYEQEVPETDEMESQKNPVESCALETQENWISTMNSLLNSYVAKSISFDVSEDVMKAAGDLEKDVMTLLTVTPYCTCDEESHDPVETMIQSVNNIRWGIAEVKSMQRLNSFYQQTKTDLTQLTMKIQGIANAESFDCGQELEAVEKSSWSLEHRKIWANLRNVENHYGNISFNRGGGDDICNNYYRFIVDKPTVNMLPKVTTYLKSLCKKAAEGTLLRSNLKAFDIIDAELRFGKTFVFDHLRDVYWRKADIEFQKTRACLHIAKEIFGEDKITVSIDEDGAQHIVDKYVIGRVLDRPDNGILYECALKFNLFRKFFSRYSDLMKEYLDFDEKSWTQLVNSAALLKKMSLQDTDTVKDDDLSSDTASEEKSDFEMVSQQSSSSFTTSSYDRWTKDSFSDTRIRDPNCFFDAETLAVFTNEDLRERRPLGEGAFGLVFLAKHSILKQVAVKEFKCTEVQEILWELDTIKKLQKNEHVLNLYGFLYNERDHVGHLPIGYVMEYLPTSLRQVIHNKDDFGSNNIEYWYKYTLNQALHIVSSMAAAFAGVHELNVIHRDIKPDNILINPWIRIRICDFGSFSNPEFTTGQTASVGTYGYMSPEMVSKEFDAHYDNKTDVYSLGITIWELFHRELPYHGMGQEDIYSKTMHGERPEIASKAYTQPMKELIKRCWQNDPSDRPTMREIVVEVDRIREKIEMDKKLGNTMIQ